MTSQRLREEGLEEGEEEEGEEEQGEEEEGEEEAAVGREVNKQQRTRRTADQTSTKPHRAAV